MANFDPRERKETWLFQKVTTIGGTPVYRRLRYNFVQYDDSPERYLEPVNSDNIADTLGDGTVFKAQSHFGQMVGFEFFDARPLEVQSVDDYDAAGV